MLVAPLAVWVWTVATTLVLSLAPGVLPTTAMAEALEARGAEWPSQPPPTALPHGFELPFTLGGEERACVLANNQHARSGDWVFWPYGYASHWNPAAEALKTGWKPMRMEGDPESAPLHLLAVQAQPPFRSYQLTVPAFTAYGWVDGEKEWFYAVGDFILPSTGTWVIEVTSGTNWGCFVIELTEAVPLDG